MEEIKIDDHYEVKYKIEQSITKTVILKSQKTQKKSDHQATKKNESQKSDELQKIINEFSLIPIDEKVNEGETQDKEGKTRNANSEKPVDESFYSQLFREVEDILKEE